MQLSRGISLLAFALWMSSPFSPRSSTSARSPAAGNATRVTCAFSNPRYSGWCRVTEDIPEATTPEGVCQTVLSCLNTVSCTKTYCNATEIRSGWRLEKVETDAGSILDSVQPWR
ncbi:MAG TPA: hypothetical protein VF376_02130 [Thermoanaerobaculia bacterium]